MKIYADVVFADAGSIKVKLDGLIKQNKITRTKLARMVNVDYRRIRGLCSGETSRIDFDLLTRICYTLECSVSDVIEYIPPKDE